MTPIAMTLALTVLGGATAAAQDISRQVERVRATVAALRAAYGFEQNREFRVEQIDRQTKTLALGATGDLSLQNVAGDITVKTSGGRDVSVEIVRVSRGRTEADAKLGLERVTAEITTRGERGTVTARYQDDRRPPYSVSVAYNVTAPAGTRVTIETVSGGVRVSGLQGELTVKTVSGHVEVASCASVPAVRTISGNVTLRDVQSPSRLDVNSISASILIEGLKTPRLEASVISGSVTAHNVQAEGAKLGSLSGNIEFSGSVSPKGRYEFTAHSGNVRLGVTGGFDLEASAFSGRVETDPALGISRTGPNQRMLRGTAAGGGGAITAKTFSGSIWVGRKL